ncbi:hypothetical protein HMI54_008221 [Coelomomyces lativittatus]|nr:hypothetical protein HMI54_008221 [Coelomomyces lativittatus]KAJ1503642.1 hypothetical protein HMI56_002026 [Coelomomyces lativittatus]
MPHFLFPKARVAAGAIAEKYLSLAHNVEVVAFASSIGSISMKCSTEVYATVTKSQVDSTLVRCPDPMVSQEMIEKIDEVRALQDSIGGIVTCVIRNVPKGLGEPCFDKLEAQLAHAMLSIPATKGFDIGTGFECVHWLGSEHNDPWISPTKTGSNRSGGIQGGISNGDLIYFRVAFKPAATIGLPQETVQYNGEVGTLQVHGRHDPCVVPRAIPIVEAMAALVIMDALLQQNSRSTAISQFPSAILRTIPKQLDPRPRTFDTDESSKID